MEVSDVHRILEQLEKGGRGLPDPMILVYQMGRVGSNTVVRMLQETIGGYPILHAHYIMKKGEFGPYPNGEALYKLIAHKERTWKIISLVRDPVSRGISAFLRRRNDYFENLREYSAEVRDKFINDYDHHWTLKWFEREFNQFLRVNIYDHPFDYEKGYTRYTFDLADVLIIKNERLNEVAFEALEDFIGQPIKSPKVYQEGTSDKQYFRGVYDQMHQAKFTREELSKLYEHHYTRHFYSSEEIERMYQKWNKRG